MAAAVYIHNALFSRSTIRNSIHSGQQAHDISQSSSTSHSRSSSTGSYQDAQDNVRGGGGNDAIAEDEVVGARAPSAAVGSTLTTDENAERTEMLTRDRMRREWDHGRKSSEATLVPFSGRRASGKKVIEGDAARVRGGMPSYQEETTLQADEEKTNEEVAFPSDTNEHGHSGSRFVEVPLYTTTMTEPPSTPLRDSSTPPGLSKTTSPTARHQPTPYPFPTRNSTNQPTTELPTSPTSNNHRTRPKGRRRRTSPLERGVHNLWILRKGRIPNRNLSRRTRVGILVTRFVLSCILVGWTAYECARYWLAYFEFRPSPAFEGGPIPKEDPPRSHYAFTLAICASIAAGLLALDLSWFLYFVLYPLESRPVQRTPTITPIARDDPNAPTTTVPPPTSPQQPIDSSVDPLSPSRIRISAPDSDTSPDNRHSAYSTSSSRRRSRRLSKTRPESWTGYPPVPAIPPGLVTDSGDEGRPSYAETRPSRDTDVQAPPPISRYPTQTIDLSHSPPRRMAHFDQSVTEIHRDSADVTRPSSQYYSGDEIVPQVERHDRATYMLHLPINCHEPSISPLPPPVGIVDTHLSGPEITAAAQIPGALPATITTTAEAAPRRRTSNVPTQPVPKRKKWKWTRRFLHVVHWLVFIAVNIPALVNVALVPVWYNPEPSSSGDGTSTGINSPHRLSGLCRWSPDVIWAGTALPPAYPACSPRISYKAWLWGAIGRVLITFFIAGSWIILDGLWWGAWVVGTRNIGWRGSIPIPREWKPKRQPSGDVTGEESHAEDTADESDGRQDLKETGLWKRMRLMSGASKASARSGKSGRSQKEKGRESSIYPAPPVPPLDRERVDLASPGGSVIDPLSPGASTDAIAGGTSSGGEGATSPRHKVRRKPVRQVSPPTSSYFPPSAFEAAQMERQSALGIGSRRPSTHDSIGGSTVVGSPPAQSYLPSSPPFSPASPPLSGSSHHGHGTEENQTIAFGRRSMGLEMLPEMERNADIEEGTSNQQASQPPQRPYSRLARYDDPNMYGDKYSPPTPPSPNSSSYPPSSSRPSWTADMNAFSPITSPDADAPLLGRGYFMVGDGGFSATLNEGAYDEESYYRMVGGEPPRRSGDERPISPLSDRSISPTSYGHGHIAPLDVRVETPTNEGDGDEDLNDPRYNAASSNVPWYVQHASNNTSSPPPLVPAYQHPLAHGIQLAMGRPPEPPEREIRMLGGVVRRMSTIESFGSHERELELSRRGSAGTSRTNQTGRNNGAAREGTGGSGSGHSGGGRRPGTSGSGSAEHSAEKNTEEEVIARAASPTELSPTQG